MNNRPALSAVAALSACWLFSACSTIHGWLPPDRALSASGVLRAGAAKVDITPIPGYPMAGYAVIGQISRGHWLRLKARAIFLEGTNGERLALVANDLWGMPAGLVDRVAEKLGDAPEFCRLRRSEIVLAATHTHQSPGNYASSSMYNTGASPKIGFDRALFEFLAQRIASAIVQACAARQPATLHHARTTVAEVARNRSLDAFMQNPDRGELLESNRFLKPGKEPGYPAEAYRAIDPTLSVLTIRHASARKAIAVAAFFAVHPTSLSHLTAVYSSDLFGAATITAEQELQRLQGDAPVVALFNGAEGDVSPDAHHRDRRDTLRIGTELGRAIHALVRQSGRPLAGTIIARSVTARIAGQTTHTTEGRWLRTAPDAVPGISILASAEDARLPHYYDGCVEGLRRWPRDPSDPHSPKELYFDPCRVFGIPIKTTWASLLIAAPQDVPLGLYRIGALAVVTLPGEFTSMLGRRIRKAVQKTLQANATNDLPVPHLDEVLIIGLANEYLSYVATDEEYDLQHYEGASTLYGRDSGPLFIELASRLALRSDDLVPPRHDDVSEFNYAAGLSRSYTQLSLRNSLRDPLAGSLANVLVDEQSGLPMAEHLPKFCWHEPADRFRVENIAPAVVIEQRRADGSWQPVLIDGLVENDDGMRIVYGIDAVHEGNARSCVYWMPPSNMPAVGPYRFSVRTASGMRASEMFWHPRGQR